jgi:MSHA pilin protein MshA
MNIKTQGGFTLIELVVVIVILGILAAFAVPRFMGLETEARIAAVRSLAGTLRSTASMAHGVCMSRGCPVAANNQAIEGTNYAFIATYPTRDAITNLMQSSEGFTGSNPAAGQRRFTKTGAKVPAQCWVQYNEATVNGAGVVVPPAIVFPVGGNEVAVTNHLRTNC